MSGVQMNAVGQLVLGARTRRGGFDVRFRSLRYAIKNDWIELR
jgi:hypothetical protein